MSQTIALLHACGTQGLIEGVETADEAIIALDFDANQVQGYCFGRPHERVRRPREASRELGDLWVDCDVRCDRETQAGAARLAPYRATLVEAARLLVAGHAVDEACESLVRLPDADLCDLLDRDGMKAAPRVFHHATPKPALADRFAPLLDVRGSRWSRRPHFRPAPASPGEVQVTRPYPAMHGPIQTVTLSIGLELRGKPFVRCGDKTWRSHGEQDDARSQTRQAETAG